ncbi:MAG: AraC family transcriptional regulator [Megasphaera sp.]|nr:AraC family transcriptional regulator [Megasphaera sp.]MCI1248727.1 AraC family transcriptional regulator [Megasphaera sp.]
MVMLYQKKNQLPDMPARDIQLVYVGYNDRTETSLPSSFHSHAQHLEIQYVSKGKGIISIGSHLYHVGADDLIVYNRGMLHDECANPDYGLWFYNCGVRGLQLPGLPADYLVDDSISPVMHTGRSANAIRSIFSCLYEQVHEQREQGSVVCPYLLCSLFSIIRFQVPHVPRQADTRRDIALIQVKNYMDQHYMEEMTVEQLSTMAHMSVSGFAHQFKQRSGLAPLRYLIRLRIGKAQQLLFSTNLSITEICIRSGFGNISYFNNQFKKFVGMSPQSWRLLKIGREKF